MVTELLQRLNSLSQALDVPRSVVPSPLSTNFDLSTPHLFFVTLSVALCPPSGKKYARRVKALIDTGSERNYVSQELADKWNLDGTTGHPVQMACSNHTVWSKRVTSALTLKSGTIVFDTPFYALKDLSFQMILGLDWWCKYNPAINVKAGQVTGTFSSGETWTLKLVSRPLTCSSNSIVNTELPADVSPLPAEFKEFAHLFNPSGVVPLPHTSEHVFSFRFTKDCVLPKGFPIYTYNLKSWEALKL